MQCLAFFSLSLHLQVAVVLALALPFLSLSFGYVPAKHELDVAAQLVQANANELDGWEISSLVWAAARLGYRPADHVMDTLLQQVLTVSDDYAVNMLAFILRWFVAYGDDAVSIIAIVQIKQAFRLT